MWSGVRGRGDTASGRRGQDRVTGEVEPDGVRVVRGRFCFFFSSRRRHTILQGDWSSDVCSSDLAETTRLAKEFPNVDILINNVATFIPKDFLSSTDEDWQKIYDTNVMSGVRLSRADRKSVV